MKIVGIMVAIRDVAAQCKSRLLRALRQDEQSEIRQPETIAWEALQADAEDAYGFHRPTTSEYSLWLPRWKRRLAALAYIMKHLSWISPILMTERLRRGATQARGALRAGERNA